MTIEGRNRVLMRRVVGKPDDSGQVHCTLNGHTKDNPECTCAHDNWVCKINPSCPVTGHSRSVSAVAWSPDGSKLVSGSQDETVKVWDVASGLEVCTLRGHEEDVNSVAWSPDGSKLVSGSEDMTVKVWDATTGKEVCTLKGHTKDNTKCTCTPPHAIENPLNPCPVMGHRFPVVSLAFAPDNKTLVSVAYRSVKLWDLSGDTPKAKGRTLTAQSARCPYLTPEERGLAKQVQEGGTVGRKCSAGSQYIVTWQADYIFVYHVDQPEAPVASFRSPDGVRAVVCRPPLVCAGCEDGQVCLYRCLYFALLFHWPFLRPTVSEYLVSHSHKSHRCCSWRRPCST